jgi:hypothetical protein
MKIEDSVKDYCGIEMYTRESGHWRCTLPNELLGGSTLNIGTIV